VVQSVSLPDEVQEFYRKQQQMKMVGAQNFTQFQAANAIESAADGSGTGGGGNVMMDAGMGLAMGQMMAGQMGAGAQPPPAPSATPPPPPGATTFHYNGVGGSGQYTAVQIAELVAANRDGAHNVWSAGWPEWKAWSAVPDVAGLVPPPAPPAATPPPPPPLDGDSEG
jgi:hypothetical protein